MDKCSNCGTEITPETKFCSACGGKVEQEPMSRIPKPQQQEYQRPISTPLSSPSRSKKKQVIVVCAIAAVVIVLVIILIILGGAGFFRGGDADRRFVGEWETDAPENGRQDASEKLLYKFYGDGTFDIGSSTMSPGSAFEANAMWRVADTDPWLFLYASFMSSTVLCYTYEFSNNGNTLALTLALNKLVGDDVYNEFIYSQHMVLTKKG